MIRRNQCITLIILSTLFISIFSGSAKILYADNMDDEQDGQQHLFLFLLFPRLILHYFTKGGRFQAFNVFRDH